jgi:WhiB family redox-sensing transcriptional regulator
MGRDWQERGACKGVAVEFFFPPVDEDCDGAKAVCAMCPVREPCLEHALSVGERFGVWGGLTPAERRTLAGRRARTAAALRAAAQNDPLPGAVPQPFS